MKKTAAAFVISLGACLVLANGAYDPACVRMQTRVCDSGRRAWPTSRPMEAPRRFDESFQDMSGSCRPASHPLDTYLAGKGLVDIRQLDSTIRVRLIYAEADNFLGEKVYEGMTKAWLRPEAARMVAKAQRSLKRLYPERTLIIYDAARPMSVQRKMWQRVRGTDKTNYVSNPSRGGGLHNYGMAVDVGIVDEAGRLLPMGTPVDFFGPEAHTTDEEALVREGRLTPEERANRLLLRRLMKEAGFRPIPYEWWHFNACSRAYARENYPVID